MSDAILEKRLNQAYRLAIEERFDIKSQLVKWLASIHTKYHLTISFIEETEEYWNRKLLNQLLQHLNRRIFRKRYQRGESYLRGVVVKEPTWGFNTEHYHILLEDSEWLPEYDRMDELVSKQVDYLGYDRNRKLTKRNYVSSYMLQDYFNDGENRLEGYLLKQFENYSNPLLNAYGSVAVLGPDQVAFCQNGFAH